MKCSVCLKNEAVDGNGNPDIPVCNQCLDLLKAYDFLIGWNVIDKNGNPVLKTISQLKKVSDRYEHLSKEAA